MDTTIIAGKATPDIGLGEANTKGVAALLGRLLADEHVLFVRLRNYHWNLVGMAFGPLHALFQQQYEAWLLRAHIEERG